MTQLGESTFTAPAEEPEEKEEEIKGIKIRFSLFFDGTLNNRANVEAREKDSTAYGKNKSSGSYDNDRSNIAKMEPYIDKAVGFDFTLHSYIEGVGTLDLQGDSGWDAAFGTGDTGVKNKVGLGLDEVVHQVQGDKGPGYGATIDELVFDVFGFSRGAAGARYFVHQALNDKPRGRGRNRGATPRPIARRLRAAGFEIENVNVKIKFVGLYDTVASEGVSHSNDTQSLKLDSIAKPEVETVIQLAAAAEHRANFSLTTIESASGKGKEIFLPGVHSDIGGGYRDDTAEDYTLYKSYSREAVEEDMNNLMKAGWYRKGEIWIEDPPDMAPGGPSMGMGYTMASPPQKYKLKVRRHGIGNHYSKIALHIMADFSRQAKMNVKKKLERKEEVPPDLAAAKSDLEAYAQAGSSSIDDWVNNRKYAWLPELHHDQLHFSSHYTLSKGVYAAMKPNLISGKRVRKRHYG